MGCRCSKQAQRNATRWNEGQSHNIGNDSRATLLKFVCARMLHYASHYPLCQPVNCIFWPIRTLNWLVAASKLHNDRALCCTAEWPYCPFPILWRSRGSIIFHSSPASYCAEKSVENLEKFFVTVKIFDRTKCPTDQKLCRTKPNFEIFSQTNVQCPAPFQGSKRNS